jgi:sensor domain CHASE-containing protein
MSDIELITVLFEHHLNTISAILAIVGVIFAVLGIISYNSISRHIKKSIDTKVQSVVAQEIVDANIKDKIEKQLNSKIETLNITIEELVSEDKNEVTL